MEYKLLPLNKYNNTEDDLLFWIKHFYVYKFIHVKKDAAKLKDDFDLAYLTGKLLNKSTDTMYKVLSVVSEASVMGLSVNQHKKTFEAFYKYVHSQHLNSIKEIDQAFIEDWILKVNHDKKQSTKSGYYTHLKTLFNFIQESNTQKGSTQPYFFNIGKDSHGKAKKLFHTPKEKTVKVWLDTNEMIKLDKNVLTYKGYRNEFERAKQVLIVRLFMFACITTSELMHIKNDDWLDVKDDMSILELKISNRIISLPRRKFITYINTYRKLNECKKGEYFFNSNRTCTQINNIYLSTMLKKHFENSKIKKSKITPEILRFSGAIYLHHERGLSDKKIQEYLGLSSLRRAREIINIGKKDKYIVTDFFDAFIDI